MPWTDRIREAAYTSPSGTRTVLTYENVSRSVEKRTSAFDFPDASGTYIQDLGHSGRKYPMRLFFWGDDYDLAAKDFEASLLESGPGTLEHPSYGRVVCVPFGAITRRDDLKTAANQAVIEVTLWETIAEIYPLAQDDPASQVATSIKDFNVAAAGEFEQVLDIDSAVEQATFKSRYNAVKASVTSGLARVAAATATVREKFNTINESINASIDLLVAQPLALGFQTLELTQTPARATAAIQDRLDAYQNLAGIIIAGGVATPGFNSSPSNTFRTSDLYAAAYLTGSVASVLNNEFSTKTQALESADAILSQFEEWVAWRDANLESLGEIDTGAMYQALQKTVALTTGFLVDISFNLKQERALILPNPRSIVDLVAELYGSVDEHLDFFINSNALTGSEILELPAGRRVVFYV